MKFLVVDDSATMRRILANSLQRIGYTECAEAADGREALERIDDTITFVISDWNMPNMSGLELVRELRAREATAKLPIIMVTTRSLKGDIIAAVDAGADSYVVKPFTPQILKERIEAVLNGQPTVA